MKRIGPYRPLIGLRSAVVSDVDDLCVSDDPVDTELESCVEDVPLLQSPGDGRVVDVEGLHRSQHGHPEVLEIQQVAVSHHDVGDGLRGEVEVEVTVLDDRDVVEAVQEDSRVPSGDGLDPSDRSLCVDSVQEDVVGHHECSDLVLKDVGHRPHLSVGVGRVLPVDGCCPVCLSQIGQGDGVAVEVEHLSVEAVLGVCSGLDVVCTTVGVEVSCGSSVGRYHSRGDLDAVVGLSDLLSGCDRP